MAAEWLEDEAFEPVGIVRVTTENSIWLVTAEHYQRMPRQECPRPPVVSIKGRLADATWHGLRRCWWRTHDGERRLRLLPTAGPVDGAGVVSGPIVAIDGTWIPIATADGRVSGDASPSRR